MSEKLLLEIEGLAGSQRSESFVRAARLAIERGVKSIVETGCYRGIQADGQSTVIWSILSKYIGCGFVSVDTDLHHVGAARDRVGPEFGECIRWVDSVLYLSSRTEQIGLLYLDSYDYEEKNPLPSQIHQVAEIGAAFGKLASNAIVLLDDCNIPGGGKGLLTDGFLKARGFTLEIDGYQKLFVR